MSSTFGSFETAKSGLSVSMQQLNVTEQNITNVNTEGYTRQRIRTSAKEPASGSYLVAQLNKSSIGQGVETTGVEQIRSAYLDQQYRNLNTNYNYSNTRNDALKYLDGLFNELNEDSSLTTSIGSFFSALNTFSSDTSSKEYRTNVQQQAQSMTESFRNVYEEMQSLWKDQNDNISTTSQKINSLAQKIASLNDSIAKSQQTVGSANDLNDERNLLLDELSSYTNITYAPNSSNNAMIDVKIGGLSLVDGRTANQITVDSASNYPTEIDTLLSNIATYNATPGPSAANLASAKAMLQTYGNFTFSTNSTGGMDVALGGAALVTGTGSTTVEDAAASNLGAWVELNRNNLTLDNGSLSIEQGTLTGGQLYASMEMLTNKTESNPGIPYYMDQLNTLVRDIAQNINDIHQKGFTYPDSGTSVNNVAFFEVPEKKDASGHTETTTDGTYTYTVYDYSKLNAGNFTLSDEVLANPYNIAGSSEPVSLSGASTQTGNNTVALQLFNDLQSSSYYDKLNSIVANLAISSNTTDSIMSTKKSLLDSVENQRKSTSAVSLDEETTNLIIFQQSYNAAARIITTLDDMLNTMINKMGIS